MLFYQMATFTQDLELDRPNDPVGHLLKTALPTEFKVQSGPSPSRQEFASAISGLSQYTERSDRAMYLDGKGFSQHIGWSGK